jgi:hypothetical protein
MVRVPVPAQTFWLHLWGMSKRCSRREKRKHYAGERPSKWLAVYKFPCVSRLRCEKKAPELLSLASCKREPPVHRCGRARCGVVYHCDVNGDLYLSICAIVYEVHLLGCLALSLSFDADVCTVGKLSRRTVTTDREGYDCANSDDSWFHVDVIANTKRRDQAVRWERFRGHPAT